MRHEERSWNWSEGWKSITLSFTIGTLEFPRMHANQKTTTWGSKRRQAVVWVVGTVSLVLAVLTLWISLRSSYWYPRIYFFWIIAPPAWFFVEFYFVFDRRDEPDMVDLVKAGQDVSQKFWAALIVLLAGIGYFQWHLSIH
jgi:hypothetical protein